MSIRQHTLMHCFSCVVELTSLAVFVAATALSLLLLPITLLRGESYSGTTGYLGDTLPLMLEAVIQLVLINALLLVMLQLATASVFTRSAATVFNVFSSCWSTRDSLVPDSDCPFVDEAAGLTAA